MTCTDVKERTEHVAPPDQCSLFSSTNVPIDAALNLLYIYSSLTFITCAFLYADAADVEKTGRFDT